jgi:hypothetical protein
VTVVAKHDSKEEGESDDSEACGICLPVVGDTIGVGNQLRGGNDVVVLKISGRVEQHFFVFILAPRIEFNCWELLKSTFDGFFHSQGGPNEASEGNVRSISLLKHVKGRKDRLLFCHIESIELQTTGGSTRLSILNSGSAVNAHQVVNELLLGHVEQSLAVFNFKFLTVELLFDHAKSGHFEALSHERVADFLNSVADHTAVLVDHHVDSLFNVTLIEGVEVGQGLSSGRSEK